MNFKLIAAAYAAVASLAVLGSAPIASAKTDCHIDVPAPGWDICTTDNGDYAADLIGVWRNNKRVADIEVICLGDGGHRWKGNRNKSYIAYNDMQELASWWCRNY